MLQFVCIAAGGLVAELKKGESPTRKLLDEMIADITKIESVDTGFPFLLRSSRYLKY